jgi:hypothetical protein
MATYAHGNFEQIASAIGMEVGQIAKHENRFEAAAYWYRLDRRRPTRITPSKSREKLDRIAKAARRLLTSLGVNDPDEAADGPKFSTPSSWRASPTRTLSEKLPGE